MLIASATLFSSCSTLQQIAALKDVKFNLRSVQDMQLAGINVQEVRSFSDIRPLDIVRLTAAVTRNELPMSFQVNIGAENPADNPVIATLVGLDWTLFLDDQETIGGALNDQYSLQPGVETGIPLSINLDVFKFLDRSAQDIVELALAVAGQGGEPKRIKIMATPTVSTPIGPIRYPNPVTIVSRSVGSAP
ncbi:MAG: LEA type 2 family protein [Rhodothermales bacterium]